MSRHARWVLIGRRSISSFRRSLTPQITFKGPYVPLVWEESPFGEAPFKLRRQRGSGLLGDHVFSVPIGPGFIVAAAVALLMLAVCGSSPL
ncbi:hypothetical protein DLJ82_0175 [Rhizobium leguminosarum]|uniref:Uncharacterized protein n=1 Tax=Rhizobium leguminosarum TaxID=384 RepID=A0A2Z4Y9P8_RHILE|nr:hypothetical protein DLJ82_0175 [Rhizobium leguminosarum]